MKRLILLLLAVLNCCSHLIAQETLPSPAATQIIQQSPPVISESPVAPLELTTSQERDPITIPAGTSIEVEAAYTVSSIDVRTGELISFRVLVPVIVEEVVLIQEGSLVTARVTFAKRGGRWGKAGRLSWEMVDVIAVDNSRIPLAPAAGIRSPQLLLPKGKEKESSPGQASIKGKSHSGEVAARTIIAAAIFPPLAPLALMHGFKRGENAVLPEGKRFVVAVKTASRVLIKHSTPH